MVLSILVKIIGVYIATLCFGILINVQPKSLNLCAFVGVLGYLSFVMCNVIFGGYITGSVTGAIAIGVFGMIAARYKKTPVIVFSIPGLVPLVPGGQAYQVMKNVALGNTATALSYLNQVMMIAGAIALGFLFAELIIQVYNRIEKVIKLKKLEQ